MIYILIIVIAIGILLANTNDAEWATLGMLLTVLSSLFLVFGVIISYCNYNEIVHKLKYVDEKITITTQTRDELFAQLKNVTDKEFKNGIIASADTPYSTLMKTYTDTQKALMKAKKEKVELLTFRDAARNGLFGAVTRWVE